MGARRILWAGVLLFVVFSAICVFTHGVTIPEQLRERANGALNDDGWSQIDVGLEGQRAFITGTLADSADISRVVDIVRDIPGIVTVSHQIQVSRIQVSDSANIREE